MSDQTKRKYEKPIALDTGSAASVLGARCSPGGLASDGCVDGSDPHVAPVCQPGLTATFNCSTGSTNTNGNCGSGGVAYGVCSPGSSPEAKYLYKQT